MVLPADKGNATVVMNTTDYTDRISTLLEDGTYRKIRNPTARISRNINKLIKASTSIPDNMKERLTVTDPKTPLLYGLPKIHKEGTPLRPIVSAIGSATHPIARLLVQHLQPAVGKTASFIKDSADFINKIQSITLQPEHILVSFDVVSLFTNIPMDEALPTIRPLLPDDLYQLATACISSTYFYWNGQYYEQIRGAAMGSPLSPIIANLYLEKFKQDALSTAKYKPTHYFRYIDDMFATWPHGRMELDNFLHHLNTRHPTINFTMEVEKDNKLPFLDTLITRSTDGKLNHQVYRKPTHTDRYLHASSHHHPAQKRAVIKTLINRAQRISDITHIEQEKTHLLDVL